MYLRQAARLLCRNHATTVFKQSTRSSTTASAGFGGDLGQVYAQIATQHHHPQGPWPLVVERVAALSVPSGGTVVDVATGTGEPAASIAKALPELKVVATDVNPDMIDRATAFAAENGLSNMTTQVADAEDMPFDDNSVDVVTCCYGYMFPADKAKAVAEAARVLKPGGTLVATWWISSSMLSFVGAIRTAALGDVPPAPGKNPMALADGSFDDLAKAAGLSHVETSTSSYPFNIGPDREFQYKAATILIQEMLEEAGPEAQAKARAFFEDKIDEYSSVNDDGERVVFDNVFAMGVWTK
eukprot:m.186075 g.186075  ORF g.186075 m.186075 type:complete len:299 (-) comp16658_c0_seq1:114-1010(-)